MRVAAARSPRALRRALAALTALGLVAACSAQPAVAYRLGGKRWPGRNPVITYWNGTGYDEEVAVAVRAWNTSGARVRFVRAKRSRAVVQMTSYKVSAGVLDGYGASGRASVGFSPFSYVRVSRGGRGAAITGVIAHELGHVLGLDHDNASCNLMNTLPWTACSDEERNCDLIQADDLSGVIKRYGGKARPRRGELCPPPPLEPVVRTLPNSYRVQMTFNLPQALSVGGYALRVGVGSCPDPSSVPTRTQAGAAGESVLTEVTPDDPQAAGKLLCVRLWSSGELGRISRTSTTATIDYRPDPLPAPARLTASASPGGASIGWAEVTHRALTGYEVAYQAGDACPAAPTDVPPGQRAGFTPAQGLGARLSVVPGRYCIAVWSRDYFGRLSTAAATATVVVPAAAP